MQSFTKDKQYYKFSAYGFLRNLRFFDAFFILFLVDKGLSFTQIGVLYAIREIMISLFEIPSGIIADTYGRKSALLASFTLYIVSFIIFSFTTDFWLFIFAFSLFGVAEAFRSGTHKAMIMEYLKLNNWGGHKVNYYGHTRSWSQKGSAISALLAGILVFWFGNYQVIFLLSIVPYLLNFALIITYPSVLNKKSASTAQKNKPSFRATFQTFFQMIKKPKVFAIIHAAAVHSAFQKAIKDYVQLVMISVAFMIPLLLHVDSTQKNGLLIGVFYFLIFLLTSQASKGASYFDEKTKGNTSYKTLVYSFLFGILSGLFYFYEIPVLALLAFAGIFIVENIRKPILTGLLADEVPSEILSSVLSAQSQWKTILTAGIALLFGVFADYFGMALAFVSISSFLFFITIILKFLEKTK